MIGADGAVSAVARQAVPGANRMRHVFAYHEIVRSPPDTAGGFDRMRCDVYYDGALSPDFTAGFFRTARRPASAAAPPRRASRYGARYRRCGGLRASAM